MPSDEFQEQARELLRLVASWAVPVGTSEIPGVEALSADDPHRDHAEVIGDALPPGATPAVRLVLLETCRITVVAALALAEVHGIAQEDAMETLLEMVDRGPDPETGGEE